MSELEEVLNKIFDEQEEQFKQMIAETKKSIKESFKDGYEKYNAELAKED